MSRRVLVSLALLALAACKDKPPGPPNEVRMVRVIEYENGNAELQGRVFDADFKRPKPTGTVHYTVYEGHPDAKKIRCTMDAELAESHYRNLNDEGEGFSIPITLASDCSPLPDGEQTYGLISVELSSGERLADAKYSWVPKGLGGTGDMNFPEHHERVIEQRAAQDTEKAREDALFAGLGRVAALDASGAPGPGQPCDPPPHPSGAVLRANVQTLAWISAKGTGAPAAAARGPIRDSGAFEGTNGYLTWALFDHLAKPSQETRKAFDEVLGESIELVELVVPDKLESPKIVDSGAADRTGTFTPGVMIGEVWIVDFATAKILCRAAVAATDIESATGEQWRSSQEVMQDQFASSVSRRVSNATESVAPGLRPPPPSP